MCEVEFMKRRHSEHLFWMNIEKNCPILFCVGTCSYIFFYVFNLARVYLTIVGSSLGRDKDNVTVKKLEMVK